MSILAIGSIALDTVTSPKGKAEEVLGGSAVYFGCSASLFEKVTLIGVVGTDFPRKHLKFLQGKGIDTRGIKIANGKTFRWVGSYTDDFNEAITHSTCLNVFETFSPILNGSEKNVKCLFLANIDPCLQLNLLKNLKSPKLIASDTMNHWIMEKPGELTEVIKGTDIFFINYGEAKLLTKCRTIPACADKLLKLGPQAVIIKKGEHGAVLFSKNGYSMVGAYPTKNVVDTTGAGDSFAGGFLGYVVKSNKNDVKTLRKALLFGTVTASFAVESFGPYRLGGVSKKQVSERFNELLDSTRI